ncbi:peptidoglycan DD-metalloendopeptidase family protein [Archangium violaceum]|uniref:M23 family metallopeptidase n=1 Tax=Archangium violaceum TaxID=83451 RepID=UPI002B2FE32F|nr:peptidoglycan DD-metalloendopeptidase family protein [Archangium gephyra]
MHHTMKHTLAALASLALIPTAVAATQVGAPISGTVTNTTYSSSGAFHGAVDIAGQCNVDPVHAPFPGTWNVTIRTTGVVCNGNGSGNQNEAKHVFADGFTFRLWHFIKTDKSYDRTCTNNCVLGVVGGTGNATGPHVHMQLDKNGTNSTSWYSGYTVKGEFLSQGEVVGVL